MPASAAHDSVYPRDDLFDDDMLGRWVTNSIIDRILAAIGKTL
jgi:hypothetical protein